MVSKVYSAAVLGVDAYEVEVELDAAQGLPAFSVVGLPDTAVKESRDRVRAAIQNSGLEFPMNRRFTANLAPADTRKEGPAFDLPLALGVLLSIGGVPEAAFADTSFVGELSLDGALRPVRGALSVAVEARRAGRRRLVLPAANAPEAAVVEGIQVLPAASLAEVVAWARGDAELPTARVDLRAALEAAGHADADLSDVKGQAHVKRALEVAAAGGHNVLMIGPPGSGKTLLARCLPGILPALTLEESIEVTKVHSVAGLLPHGTPLVSARPFRRPHHTISHAGLIGGGSNPRPGEVSLAHHGLLFLDELPEFGKSVLEVLRQPLEDGRVTISRAAASLTYPSRCMLAAAMNPCPCGHLGDTRKACRCSATQVAAYMGKLSGPLLDRIDIHVEVPSLGFGEMNDARPAEASATVRARVQKARGLQAARFAAEGKKGRHAHCNAQMGPRQIRLHCALNADCVGLIRQAVERLGLSARAYDRILKVARTIADLEGAAAVAPEHISEAIQYRTLDRKGRTGAGG